MEGRKGDGEGRGGGGKVSSELRIIYVSVAGRSKSLSYCSTWEGF